jgi:Ca2+/H+ antiporter
LFIDRNSVLFSTHHKAGLISDKQQAQRITGRDALFVVSFGLKLGKINRFEGALLLAGFIAYLYLLFLQA